MYKPLYNKKRESAPALAPSTEPVYTCAAVRCEGAIAMEELCAWIPEECLPPEYEPDFPLTQSTVSCSEVGTLNIVGAWRLLKRLAREFNGCHRARHAEEKGCMR